MIKIQAEPGSDRGPVVGRIGDAQARREIELLLGPVAGRMVDWTAGIEGEIRLVHLARGSSGTALQEPLVRVDRRAHLLAAGFVRGLENRMAQSERDVEAG